MADSEFRIDANFRERTKEENNGLVKKIIKFCNRSDYKRQNVLLVGQSGSGKSCAINTILYPIIGDYYERAKPGAGNVTTKTLELKWYPNCAAKPADFEHLDDEEIQARDKNLTYEKDFKTVLDKLPNLFDAAGMKNVNSPETREILSLLIGGFISPETTIASLEEEQRNGPGWLKTKYSTAKDEYKMSCVVFVCSCLAPIPYDLIKCVREVIEEVDPDTSRKKYDCDLYVLITKYDRVKSDAGTEQWTAQGQTNQPENLYSCDNSNSHTIGGEGESPYITWKEFREFEEKLAEAFVMKGNFKDSHRPWASYNDLLPHGNVHVDNNSLKLLHRLTAPLHIDQRVDPRGNWLLEGIKYMIFRAKGASKQKYEINIRNLISVVIAFMAVLFVIYLGLNSGPARK